jgi:bacteriorhodopsin
MDSMQVMPIEHDLHSNVARLLKSAAEKDKEEFEMSTQIAQIFSGAMFGALAVYLVVTNTTRLSYIHRASIEKRLNYCCLLNAIVAALSAFLNLFQLTELDNFALPGQRQFVVDTCRPIEWILTCPLMQLSLVLMGGPRIPDYRRLLMPATSLIVLSFGSCTLFVDKPYIFLLWACGFSVHCCAMALNRQQIIEHSRGTEGLLSGDSEFRKATLILMITWIPFPTWFLLSPEGFGLVTNITIIQLGWAFLNIVPKFTLTFYMQRIKDNYGHRLKVKRAVQQSSAGKTKMMFDDENEDDQDDVAEGELGGCVLETMTFLGMAENTERFLRLLKQARITSLDEIARLERTDCEQLQLPYDLVTAVQKRHKVWAMEMVDDAEKGLEAGEKYYKIDPSETSNAMKALQSPGTRDFRSNDCYAQQGASEDVRIPFVQSTSPSAAPAPADPSRDAHLIETIGKTLEQFENRLLDKVDQAVERAAGQSLQNLRTTMERSQSLLEGKIEYVFAMQGKQHREATQKDIDAQFDRLGEKIAQCSKNDGGLSTLSFQPMEKMLKDVTEKVDGLRQSQDGLRQSQDSALTRLGGSITETTDGWANQMIQESKVAAFTLQSKLVAMEEAQNRKHAEVEERIAQRLQRLIDESNALQGLMTQQTQASSEKLDATMNASKTGQSKMEEKLENLVKDMNSETAKQFEMGLGMFSNALRAQLDTMQAAQVGARKESDQQLTGKLDGLTGRTKEQSARQLDAIKGLQRSMEDAMQMRSPSARARAQDSAKSSVADIEQSPNWWSGDPNLAPNSRRTSVSRKGTQEVR